MRMKYYYLNNTLDIDLLKNICRDLITSLDNAAICLIEKKLSLNESMILDI